MVPPEIRSVIDTFREALVRKGYRIEKIILFGSYSIGKYHDDSDIDLAIISPDFGKDRFEEGVLLRGIASSVDPRLEPIPISVTNFDSGNWIPLVYEIKEKGIVV
jgi:predicted nucleotidyltransferase